MTARHPDAPNTFDLARVPEAAPLAVLRTTLVIGERALAAVHGHVHHRQRLESSPLIRQQIKHLLCLLDAYDLATDADLDSHDNRDIPL